jgi:hypothetical protein
MATYPPDPKDQFDISQNVKATPDAEIHMHRINRGDHPGTAERGDFDSAGVEVPARVSRERINPAIANAQRRAPLIDVTAVTSGHGNSHIAEPPPSRL